MVIISEYNCYYEKIGNEVKDISNEIDFDLPNGWEYTRLSSICWLDDTKVSTGEELPYLDAKTLRGKSDKIYLTRGKIIEYGQKIILVDGENSGEVFDVPYRGYMGSTFKILAVSKNANIYYINIILNFFRDLLKGNKIGAAIPHLNKNLFKSLLIGLPPLKEQKRIVKEMENFEPLIAEYDTLEQEKSKLDSEIYDKLKKSILQYAIQGKLVPQAPNDEPASELLKRIRAEKKAQLGKKYVESYIYKGDDNCYYEHIDGNLNDKVIEVPFDLPEKWVWSKVGDIAFVTKLAGFEYSEYIAPNLQKEGIPLFKGKNIQNSQIIYDFEGYIPEHISNMLSRSQITKKCILTPYVGSIGNIGIHNKVGKYHLGSNVGKMELLYSGIAIEEFLVFYLKSIFGYLELTKHKKATAQESISIDAIRDVYVPLPPISEQQRIVDKLDKIFAKL